VSKSYQANVSEGQTFELTTENLSDFNAVQDAEGNFHILEDGQAYRAKIIHGDKNTKQYTVEVNGNPYTIQLADEYDKLVDKMGLKVGDAQHVSDVKAPMPGLVLEVNVSPGDTVAKGDALLILEAMKMENVLKSHGDGVVKSVHIKKGDAVDKAQLLIEME
jgi:biotin carboxyl carrier protein